GCRRPRNGLRVRHTPPIRIRRSGSCVPVDARTPRGAGVDRVDPRTFGHPCRGVPAGRRARRVTVTRSRAEVPRRRSAPWGGGVSASGCSGKRSAAGSFRPGEYRFLVCAAVNTADNAWTGLPNPVSGQPLRDSCPDRKSTPEHRRYAPPPRQAVEDHVDDSWRSDDLAGRARRGASEGVFLDRSWGRGWAAMRGRGRAPGFYRLRGPRRSTEMPLSAR